MKSEKLMKLLGICSCCVLLGGCAGVNARVQETETVVEETEQNETENDVEEMTAEAVTEVSAETEQILDQSQEIKETEEENSQEEDIAQTSDKETEKESESESEEEKRLLLEYQIEDQELEIGKCFGDITMPEYAEAEDGSQVTGKVEWRRPGGGHAFDPDMALTGEDGEKRTWEWTFVPDEGRYESVSGTVEITMKSALPLAVGDEEDEMTKLKELWKKKGTEENAGGSSSSGSSIGASNVIKVSDIKEVANWMGSLMTGTGVLGDQKGSTAKAAGKEDVNLVYGTTANEAEYAEPSGAPEAGTGAAGTEEKNTVSVQISQQKGTDGQRTETESESESSTSKEQKEDAGLTGEEAKKYGEYGMTAFTLAQAVSQIVHGNTLK